MNKLRINDFVLISNGTIGRITGIIFFKDKYYFKLRVVNSCKGKLSSKERVGSPYTYSFYVLQEFANKKYTRLGTEYLLIRLFRDFKRG